VKHNTGATVQYTTLQRYICSTCRCIHG